MFLSIRSIYRKKPGINPLIIFNFPHVPIWRTTIHTPCSLSEEGIHKLIYLHPTTDQVILTSAGCCPSTIGFVLKNEPEHHMEKCDISDINYIPRPSYAKSPLSYIYLPAFPDTHENRGTILGQLSLNLLLELQKCPFYWWLQPI